MLLLGVLWIPLWLACMARHMPESTGWLPPEAAMWPGLCCDGHQMSADLAKPAQRQGGRMLRAKWSGVGRKKGKEESV